MSVRPLPGVLVGALTRYHRSASMLIVHLTEHLRAVEFLLDTEGETPGPELDASLLHAIDFLGSPVQRLVIANDQDIVQGHAEWLLEQIRLYRKGEPPLSIRETARRKAKEEEKLPTGWAPDPGMPDGCKGFDFRKDGKDVDAWVRGTPAGDGWLWTAWPVVAGVVREINSITHAPYKSLFAAMFDAEVALNPGKATRLQPEAEPDPEVTDGLTTTEGGTMGMSAPLGQAEVTAPVEFSAGPPYEVLPGWVQGNGAFVADDEMEWEHHGGAHGTFLGWVRGSGDRWWWTTFSNPSVSGDHSEPTPIAAMRAAMAHLAWATNEDGL